MMTMMMLELLKSYTNGPDDDDTKDEDDIKQEVLQ